MSTFWAMILQPGNKYSQFVKDSFRITMASLDITSTSDRPIQVMMAYERKKFLLCTLHKDKPWQVQLDVLVPKEAVVTLSCNGGSYVHLIGHYRIGSIKHPFNSNWITTLSWHILGEKVNELKNKGTCLEELTEYLYKYTTVKIEENWIVTPYIINKKQIQEDRIPFQILNLKRKSFMKDNNRTEETKRARSLLHCNENINFNNNSSENPSKVPSEESSESFSEISFEDSSMESNDDDEENDKENKSPIYQLRSKNRQKNGRKNENKSEIQKRRKKESEKQEIKKKQQKAKIIEEKSKEKDPDETKKNSKQQDIRIIKGGVKVQELRPGTGKIAEMDKYVTIYYVAYVKTGRDQMLKEFDRIEQLGFRFKLGAGFVIKGLDVGVVGMKIDEKRRLIIPSNMAYGNEGYGLKVPPNSTVIYDVELKKVE
ncbi:PREDICTED: 46 kDa FK506-binding nuclear protein-like [Trachymyrmex septentrionalis]|uniref:46 kDa FK506-binding nuclear protein-like n=1 Tax=Trachymyrmex septentrionalis TaxID=34720 RepID=UPI00084F5384|nr:PREDICTED: 46 kDa FK506-binding nuclear protein-like [Trachymyrmex septentrionalis]